MMITPSQQSPLDEPDGRAVDVLLDELPRSQRAADAGYAANAGVPADPERLENVRMLLRHLDSFDVADPPAELIADTLRRVGDTAIVPHAGQLLDDYAPSVPGYSDRYATDLSFDPAAEFRSDAGPDTGIDTDR